MPGLLAGVYLELNPTGVLIDWHTLLEQHGTEITGSQLASQSEFNFETLDVNGRNALHTAVIKNDPDLIKVTTVQSHYEPGLRTKN